jgi:hypothetical protein
VYVKCRRRAGGAGNFEVEGGVEPRGLGQLGGCPLLNQTKQLSRPVVTSALGDRWNAFRRLVASEDPNGRFGNGFFDALL